ncbi:MAG: sigma factor-like helix-turn-helix DNA-binding protein [Acidimicrobiales bacterium]
MTPPIADDPESPPAPDDATEDFVDCYRTHYSRLRRALCLGGADPSTAEDLAQEAFARTLVHWRRVRRGTNPPGYVYRTAFRLLSRARSLPATVTMDPAGPVGAAAGADGEATTRVAVERALAALPSRRRECAVACLVVGLPVAEAAAALGIAEGTVRKHLEEARRDIAAACDAQASRPTDPAQGRH